MNSPEPHPRSQRQTLKAAGVTGLCVLLLLLQNDLQRSCHILHGHQSMVFQLERLPIGLKVASWSPLSKSEKFRLSSIEPCDQYWDPVRSSQIRGEDQSRQHNLPQKKAFLCFWECGGLPERAWGHQSPHTVILCGSSVQLGCNRTCSIAGGGQVNLCCQYKWGVTCRKGLKW